MDPDEALKLLRDACREVLDRAVEEEVSLDTVDLAERFLALDEWLKRGGFWPKAWKRSA